MRSPVYICVGFAILATGVLFYGLKPLSGPIQVPPADLTIRLLFTGDMMFDRGVARHAAQYGPESLMKGVWDLFHPKGPGFDGIIGNLEGTITTEPSIAQKNNKILHFTFDPKFAQVVKDAGYTAVSLANNHAMDFYKAGFRSTQKFLDEVGVLRFGSPYNDVDQTVSFMAKGKRVCLVGYHDLYEHDESPIVTEIIRVRPDCSLVIVMPHWGNEYELQESERQRKVAHAFIDAGADMIIGAHPHVVQPVEIYRGKAIFYSLGNFVFDQGLSFWTEHGLAVQVIVHQDGRQDFTLIPTVLNKTRVSVATTTEEITKVLQVTGITSGEFSLKK